MLVVTVLPLLVALIGLVLYLVCSGGAPSTSPRAARVGEIMFFCGLLAFLLVSGGDAVRIRIG